MTNQTNEAAERSAHVTRGEKPPPAEWPVVRMPDGTWKLKSVVALEARIAELEAALRFYADAENWRRNGQLDPDSGNFTGGPASAALAGGKDE